jgi:hypothetical protein
MAKASARTGEGGGMLIFGMDPNIRTAEMHGESVSLWDRDISLLGKGLLGDLLGSAKYDMLAHHVIEDGFALDSPVIYGNAGTIREIKICSHVYRSNTITYDKREL